MTDEEPPHLTVRLIVCVDGTWGTSEGSYNPIKGAIRGTASSIKAISNMVKSGNVEDQSGKKFDQRVHYIQGVGTNGVNSNDIDLPGVHYIVRATSIFQGATGDGYLDILKKAYKICCEELQQDGTHEIFLFGFSRGAFIVRALASLLQYVGLVKAEYLRYFEEHFYKVLQQYSTLIRVAEFVPQGLLHTCKPSPRVRFIGAFDTVKAVFPSHNNPNLDTLILNFDLDAPYIVDHFRHALALNEGRLPLSPTLWKSEAGSPNSSFLESWFLGYHRDIGGGNNYQGLSLWPLQWVLHAATGCGLILDNEMGQYKVLFSGNREAIVTPHKVLMFDMISHHTTKKFKVLLNETSWGVLDHPRNYLDTLTSSPFPHLAKHRVFIHPSAYLLFDVIPSFRIQIYEWKYFRDFVRNRYSAISRVLVPWWEQQTVLSILKESLAVSHLRLLVYGRPGAGKSSLINRIFGMWHRGGSSLSAAMVSRSRASGVQDISTPILFPDNNVLRVHYSDGFGSGGSDTLETVENFLAEYRDKTSPRDQLHAIWYCLECSEGEITGSERKFFGMDFGGIPMLVILTKERDLGYKLCGGPHKEGMVTDQEVANLERFHQAVSLRKKEVNELTGQSYMSIGDSIDDVKKLISETSRLLTDTAAQRTLIRAQRILVKPKVVLATDETICAYTRWHCFQLGQEEVSRPTSEDGRKLSLIVMDPVLDMFNVRFSGDSELIRSTIGSDWSDLDNYASGLRDKTIPASLILLCMVDTILVTTRTIYHQQTLGRPVVDIARVLNPAGIKQACTWYTAGPDSKQNKVHSMIKSFFSENNWSPKDKSIAGLQMKLIETVELGLEGIDDFAFGKRLLEGLRKAFGDGVGLIGGFL